MKKNYLSVLSIFAFVAFASAQVTIIDTDFSEASYDDAGVQANLNAHPDWLAGHNNGTSIWTANTNEQIMTGANFAYSVEQTPITGAVNDVITVTTVVMLGFNNQAFDANDTNMALVALTPGNPTLGPGGSTAILGQQRDGVVIKAQASTSSVDLSNAGGTGDFSANPTVSQANKSAYEIVMEFTIGADAASSSKKVRIRNVGTVPESSAIIDSPGMRQEVYDALTGSGAYYFNWALGFFQSGDEINRIVNNRLKITRNDVVLSTKEYNAFDFAMYPNPVNDRLYINTKETINKIEAFDLLGKSVLTIENVRDYVDVSSLRSSIYIMKLTSDNGISTKRFIKQ